MTLDQNERKQALDVTQSFMVQAPAGSGKTELLTQRYLALLKTVTAPEEILAITFTKKAAEEMRARILSREPMDNPNRLNIQTIDAFCARLTRRMPFLSKLSGTTQVTEYPDRLYQQAIEWCFAGLNGQEDWQNDLIIVLDALDQDYAALQYLLKNLLAQRDQWLHLVTHFSQQRSPREQLQSHWQDKIEHTYQMTQMRLQKKAQHDELRRVMQELYGQAWDTWPESTVEHATSWQQLASLLLTGKGEWRQRFDKNQGFDKENAHLKVAVKSIIQAWMDDEGLRFCLHECLQAPNHEYDDTSWELLSALFSLLRVLTGLLKVAFQQAGQVDFIEIAQGALQALGGEDTPTQLALALDYQIKHILVDEFQDTSLTQYELLRRLTAGLQMGDGRTLFLVGDPMQSIYRFRQADLSLFLHVKNHGLGDLSLKFLQLSCNFRSDEQLVTWINSAFTRIFPAKDDVAMAAIQYTPSQGSKQLTQAGVHYHAASDEFHEAWSVTETIQQTLQREPEGSIVILVRARSHLAKILPLLQLTGIRYQAVELESMAQRSVVQDLAALTRGLLWINDRVAWLAILRAPWCGLSLSDLQAVAGDDFSLPIWQRLQQLDTLAGLSMHAKQRLQHLYLVVQQSLQNRSRQSLADWIQGTWIALGGPVCLPTYAEIECAAFFELLQKLEQQGLIVTSSHLDESLNKLYAPVNMSEKVCVQVMTIHKAKGLEFDTVIVPGLASRGRSDEKQLLAWMQDLSDPHQPRILLAARPSLQMEFSEEYSQYEYLRRLEKNKAELECARLLYVAATRARKAVHWVGVCSEDGKVTAGSFLSYLSHYFSSRDLPLNGSHPLPPAGERTEHQMRDVLVDTWELSPSLSTHVFAAAVASNNPTDPASYVWRDDPAAATGTLIHRILCQIAQEGLAQWNAEKVSFYYVRWKTQLLELGVLARDVTEQIKFVQQSIQQVLKSERGRWILDKQCEAVQEYAITVDIDNTCSDLIIDRTFVDKLGCRWIIDYKTTRLKSDEDKNIFLLEQKKIYQAQLTRYDHALRAMGEARPIYLALYFPFDDLWLEWETSSTVSI